MVERDVVLTMHLSCPSGSADGVRRFREAWGSLVDRNPGLTRRLKAGLVLTDLEDEAGEAVLSELRALWPSAGDRARLLGGESFGRCLNDGFLWALASGADFWLHWDDEHVCTRPFLGSATSFLRSADVWQLELTEDWTALPASRLEKKDGYVLQLPHPDERGKLALDPAAYEDEEPFLSHWPLFSLRPSVHRLAPLRAARRLRFREDVGSWSGTEWAFGLAWEAAGGSKASLWPAAAHGLGDCSIEGDV